MRGGLLAGGYWGLAVARGCSRLDWVFRCGVNRAEGRWPTRAFAWGLLAGGYSGLGVARGVSPGAGLVGWRLCGVFAWGGAGGSWRLGESLLPRQRDAHGW